MEANDSQGCRRAVTGNTQKTHFYGSDSASRREKRTRAVRAGAIGRRNVLCRALAALATLNEEDLGSRAVGPKKRVRMHWRTRRQRDDPWRSRMRTPLNTAKLPATADVRSRLIWQGERGGKQNQEKR
ncbi:hypothetical protein BH24GEM2_BH24GEM2_12680 [soil metagenome]|jgi:hypothetical protein